MLTTEGLCAGYGVTPILHDISMSVDDGEIVAVIGANGAGKSTLMKTIAGQLRPSSGSINLDGALITALPTHKRVARGIVLVPEGRHVFAPMTVLQNLYLGGYRRSRDQQAASLDRVFRLFPHLAQRRMQRAGTLSGGEQQMLAIGRGLMAQPSLLLLDEPSLGLAPIIVGMIMTKVAELNEEDGLACLLVEQNAHLALDIADRAYVFENGRPVLDGPVSVLRHDQRVREAYLGVVKEPTG